MCAAFIAMLVLAASANAEMLSFDCRVNYNGDPLGSPLTPWVQAILDDGDTPGSVKLTLRTTNLVDQEHVSLWAFNLDPALDPAALVFDLLEDESKGYFAEPTYQLTSNVWRAGGSGLYDIRLKFSTWPAGERFGVGDTAVFNITGLPTLQASSFDFTSFDAGHPHGTNISAAGVRGIGEDNKGAGWVSDDGGWTPIPEPLSMSVLLTGAVAVLVRRQRRGPA